MFILKFLFFFLLVTSFAWGQKIIFIVNSSNTVSRISHDQLQDFYFKRNRTWPNGLPIRFFDRTDGTEVRKLFLDNILKKTSRQVDQFWIGQKLYTGDSAPTKISTNSLMINLVSRFPGGIGYLSEETVLPDGVKVIEVTEL